jgi:hypothetical protein
LTDAPNAVQQFTATTHAAVAEARCIANDAVEQIDAGTYGYEAWCRSLVKFFDIVARGSATHFNTAVSHGCFPASPTTQTYACGLQPVPASVPADNNYSRQLSVAVPFTQVGGQETIPNNMIGFQPNILAAGQTTFSVGLLDAQYMGASYTGKVRLTRITSNLASAAFVDEVVTVEL